MTDREGREGAGLWANSQADYNAFRAEFCECFNWDSIPPEPYLSQDVATAFLLFKMAKMQAQIDELRDKLKGVGGV